MLILEKIVSRGWRVVGGSGTPIGASTRGGFAFHGERAAGRDCAEEEQLTPARRMDLLVVWQRVLGFARKARETEQRASQRETNDWAVVYGEKRGRAEARLLQTQWHAQRNEVAMESVWNAPRRGWLRQIPRRSGAIVGEPMNIPLREGRLPQAS